jgi:hypothetical protein
MTAVALGYMAAAAAAATLTVLRTCRPSSFGRGVLPEVTSPEMTSPEFT